MKLYTVYFPRALIKKLDNLIERGLYPNRAEAIRLAVRDLVNLHK